MRPLADRVLIRPDVVPEETASGLIVKRAWQPEQTGTVAAVGPVTHPKKEQAEALASGVDRIAAFLATRETLTDEDVQCLRGAAGMLRGLTAVEPEVKAGDPVLFGWQVGQEIVVNHGEERYLLMRQSDILCVLEETASE
jgi:co-chaperonin GroES (HSP10)